MPMATPTWHGAVYVEEPIVASHRGKDLKRYGQSYLAGTVWAQDNEGRKAARLTFEVYPARRMVLIDNVDADGSVGDAGNVRALGAGRALLDALDNKYPPPFWWIAADPEADHSPEGLILMRSRRKPGRQWVHRSDCADQFLSGCTCEFNDSPLLSD
jgi:hypothetical protein